MSSQRRFRPSIAAGVLIAALIGYWTPVRAATINVPADEPTIQDAINAASAGDVVLVAPGTYAAVAAGGILIEGASTATILANIITNNTYLSGDGGGISPHSGRHPVIMNNLIAGNSVTGVFSGSGTPMAAGGEIAMINDSDPLIQQNLIINNDSDIGADIYFSVPSGSTGPSLINNTICKFV